MYTLEDGRFLIKLARSAIEKYLENEKFISIPENTPKKLKEKAGVFITLETYPAKHLRGCIGYPEPVMPLVEAVIKAAISSATSDPRFPPVLQEELNETFIELTILTPPELLKVSSPKEYPNKIKIGEDGLIVERGYRGLLLPQVAVDEGWDAEDFLCHACLKAGLTPDAWCDPLTKIYKFSGVIFTETQPRGEIVERKLK